MYMISHRMCFYHLYIFICTQYDTYSSISYVIDSNRHLALLPLIPPPYILNFGCQPYSIIYGGFFHRLSFSLLIRLAYGFYRKLRFPIIKVNLLSCCPTFGVHFKLIYCSFAYILLYLFFITISTPRITRDATINIMNIPMFVLSYVFGVFFVFVIVKPVFASPVIFVL